ncbi:hypothetical protein CH263_06385 [Rhodococcus sp. 06-1059B-a]|nr:hypothetical protein [Rhodococcus sp. 06-1059B-a]OZD70542.1 hypothetical protein CH263_06385 [Rhodococcus sp. 06-1059B-a]
MTFLRIDTDRGSLFGPNFDAILTHFFGRHQNVEWDCHQLAAGYMNGKQALSTPIRVEHRGHWVVVARSFGMHRIGGLPEDAVRRGAAFAAAPFDAPELPRWVYDWAQSLLV